MNGLTLPDSERYKTSNNGSIFPPRCCRPCPCRRYDGKATFVSQTAELIMNMKHRLAHLLDRSHGNQTGRGWKARLRSFRAQPPIFWNIDCLRGSIAKLADENISLLCCGGGGFSDKLTSVILMTVQKQIDKSSRYDHSKLKSNKSRKICFIFRTLKGLLMLLQQSVRY